MNRYSALALAFAVLLDGGCGAGSSGEATLDAGTSGDEASADGDATLDSDGADGTDTRDSTVPESDSESSPADAAEEAPACVPKTCAELGVPCLTAQDGCGGVLNCGNCAGWPNSECSANTAGPFCGACLETCATCSQVGATCGSVADGLGGVSYCGTCIAPQTCGGGGVPNQCGFGYDACVPRTCFDQGAYCGTVSDGCGNTLPCGTCPHGQTCGGKRPGVCG